jgi:enamine deaminase RidA (YjgF/YER057c/UK114 family)
MTKLLTLLLAFLVSLALHAQEPPKDKFNLGPWENDIGYAQAVRVGNTLYISGSVGAGPMPAAIDSAFSTIQKTLAHYGLDFRHVVKENAYTTDLEALKAAKDVRKRYYGTDFPAATWVQVARLFQPDYVLEVEVVAVFPASESGATPATPAAAP